MSDDRLAARLLATFLDELDEQVRELNADLLVLERDPGDTERLRAIFRVAHTLKGAARAAGVPLVERACHALEALLAEARRGGTSLERAQTELLFAAADALADAGRRLRAGRPLTDAPLAALARALERGEAPPAGTRDRPAPAGSEVSARDDPPLRAGRATPGGAGGTGGADGPAPGRGADPADRPLEPAEGQVRVHPEKLDGLLAAAGRLQIAAGRLRARPAELEALHGLARDCAGEWRAVGRRLRIALEEAGAPAELAGSVRALEDRLRRLARETGRVAEAAIDDARILGRSVSDAAGRVRELRMRPFAEACEALPRAVRDLAAAAGKEVRLAVEGGDVDADRAVLDGVREAILHLVRNAVDHGIEPPQARERTGKPRQGTVTVTGALRGDRLVVTVADDGAGIDAAAVRKALEQRGIEAPADERELVRALLAGGLSTRVEATSISGRGVGLDIVRAAVDRIRGSVDVRWTAGRGTVVTIECPLTLATIRALVVSAGTQLFAVPTAHVERLVRLRPDALRRVDGRAAVPSADAPVPLVPLARVLGPPLPEPPPSESLRVALLSVAGRRLAVAVDELVAERELVVRPLDRVGAGVPHLTGAALLGTGGVALVLDTPAVIATGLGLPAGEAPAAEGTTAAERRRVLVVDDSITTRTLEQSILEAAGYEVRTAVDGAEGWRLLQEHGADLVVADVEMPRMDGFALCEAIRASKRFAGLPVVLVTALETPEHRERGLEVGADAYLGKSSFDQQSLVDTVRQLID